jgi:predicted Zn-dependent protease
MLTGDTTGVSEYDLRTRAKVALDELRELLGKNGSFEQDADAIILAAAKEAESAIVRGRTEFPESAEMLATESELLDLLNKAPKALATLERAFKLNPRQDWLAIRLAKRYETEDNRPKAIDVMQRCLRENPSSRSAHLQLAHILRKGDGDQKNILGHLRQSFSAGDNNFEGQFWYARELFIENNLADANALFDSLNERAPGRFRTRPSAIVER